MVTIYQGGKPDLPRVLKTGKIEAFSGQLLESGSFARHIVNEINWF